MFKAIDISSPEFRFSPSVVAWPLYFVLLLWFVFWIEVKFGVRFVEYGIFPRTFFGIKGVVLSPFIHGDMKHLYNNSIPLLLLIGALRYFYREYAFRIIVFGILISGFFTWLIARDSYHIGASGLIYVLVSFIFFKGIQTRYYRLIALSLIVVFIYGGLIWYVFPDVEKGVSWEGHLCGFFTGLFLSWIYKSPQYRKAVKYEWEHPDFDPKKDPFMSRFDEKGNFVNPPPKTSETQPVTDATIPFSAIVYYWVPDVNKENSSETETNREEP